MPRDLDLNLLRTLPVLAEERSATRAGKLLFLSQPAVSGALARLRTHFGDELLVRNGRALEPTARALELLESIRPRLIALEAESFDPTSDARVFTFGCTDAVAMIVLPSLTASIGGGFGRLRATCAGLMARCGVAAEHRFDCLPASEPFRRSWARVVCGVGRRRGGGATVLATASSSRLMA